MVFLNFIFIVQSIPIIVETIFVLFNFKQKLFEHELINGHTRCYARNQVEKNRKKAQKDNNSEIFKKWSGEWPCSYQIAEVAEFFDVFSAFATTLLIAGLLADDKWVTLLWIGVAVTSIVFYFITLIFRKQGDGIEGPLAPYSIKTLAIALFIIEIIVYWGIENIPK